MKYVRLIKDLHGQRKKYFQQAEEEIARENLSILRKAGVATALILVLFLAVTPWIIRGWTATPYHLAFLPAALAVGAGGLLLFRKGKCKGSWVTRCCIVYEAVVFLFLILIDTAGTPEGPSAFMPVMLIAMPAIFAVPYSLTCVLLCAMEALYIAGVLAFKNPYLGQYDIFISLVAMICSGVVTNLILSLRLKSYELQIKYRTLSRMDAISGIYNKQTCIDAAREYVEQGGAKTVCTLLLADLDDFKRVNDTLGHAVGDLVLEQMGKVLLRTFRSTDIVGRFGGDEFLVLVKGAASQGLMNRKCQQIQKNFRSAVREYPVAVSCSMGVVMVKNQEAEFEHLFRQADQILYEAKKSGKAVHRIALYCQEWDRREAARPGFAQGWSEEEATGGILQ